MNHRQKNLFNQLRTYREWLLATVAELSEEQANQIPTGFRNNVRWNLGHVYLDQYLWLEAVTREESPVPRPFLQWFNFGTTPTNFTDATPSAAELINLLANQPTIIEQTYGVRLDQAFEPTEMGMRTIEDVLVRTIFHEGMHTQAINDLKKFLNK
ncbi:DinB superfamily protein [Amphibacillus marinus]|uniref:DinB superfamily protein n=1 Tax=Amphibacillus marinus TaxID=872970 RepID=A0A1H8L3K9_9BACI|nr:DinB family protein [Amphibacillus marinus]SEN99258.1 DinB superfamily protein [Amphibacillus marinus]